MVSKDALLAVAIEHGVGRISPDEVQQTFHQLEKEGDLVNDKAMAAQAIAVKLNTGFQKASIISI